MSMRSILAVTASLMMAGAASLTAEPAAAASNCPTVNPVTGEISPRLMPDLDYSGCSFVGASMNAANLSGANLSMTQWGDTQAVDVNLSGTKLTDAVFLGPVNLTGANLSGVDLNEANLGDAFVNADSQLGCGITGIPLTLPVGITLNDDCLSAVGRDLDSVPQPCPAYISETSTTPITISEGPHALWVEGDVSCSEANELLHRAAENGRVNSAEFARLMPQILNRSERGSIDLVLSEHATLSIEQTPSRYSFGARQARTESFDNDPAGGEIEPQTTVTYKEAVDDEYLSHMVGYWEDTRIETHTHTHHHRSWFGLITRTTTYTTTSTVVDREFRECLTTDPRFYCNDDFELAWRDTGALVDWETDWVTD